MTFQIGDIVTFKHQGYHTPDFDGSEGVVVGKYRGTYLWEVDWTSGPGVEFNRQQRRYSRLAPDMLELCPITLSYIPEPDDLDLI